MIQDFAGAEPLLDRPIAFHPCFMPITTKCVIGALFLSQAWYWRTKGRKNDGWVYKTHYEFFQETGLSQKQQIRVRKMLCTKPWWQEKVAKVNGVPTYHYRIDRLGLMAELTEVSQKIRDAGSDPDPTPDPTPSKDRRWKSEAETETGSNNSPSDRATPQTSAQTSDSAPLWAFSGECPKGTLQENAERELSGNSQRELSLYKEAETTTKDYSPENTNPDRAGEKIEFENSQLPNSETLSRSSDATNDPTSLDKTQSSSTLLQQSISGEGDSSAVCSTLVTAITATGYLTQTEKRFSPRLSRLQLAEITQEIIDTYNKVKPACWGACTKITAFLTGQVAKLIELYQNDFDLPSAIDSLKNDVAAAHLSCKGDDFYDKPSFGIPSISFFLHPHRIDKLRERAQVWYDKPQAQKQQLAQTMVKDATEGIPCWETGTILKGMRLRMAKTRYGDWYKENDKQCPPIDYLQKYFPEILGAA